MDFLRTLLRTAAAAAVVLTLLPGCQPEVAVAPSTGPSVHLGRPDDTPKGILPYISLSTDDWMPVTSKEKYLLGSMVTEDAHSVYTGEGKTTRAVYIKGRGQSSWGQPKKPYRLKLETSAKMFGLRKDKGWILVANYSDKSLVRNLLAARISKILEMDWTPEMLPVDFYLNGEYLGVYNLVENKEVAKHKVDIDLPGGDFLLEIEQNLPNPRSFKTAIARVPVQFEEPELPSNEDFTYVQDYLNRFEAALFGDNFTDPETGYRSYIDVRSFVNNYIAQELAKNVDGNLRKSSPLTLERKRGLCLYFLWDFDLAFGNADYFENEFPGSNAGPEGWFIREYGREGYGTGWYPRLFQDPWFAAQVRERWNEVYPALSALSDEIDVLVASLKDGPERNFARWDILNRYVWPNTAVTGSYAGEVAHLKNFYSARLAWMHEAINKTEE